MADWAQFSLYAVRNIVQTVFSLDCGNGWSLGDFDIACLIIGMVATALVIKTGSFAQFQGHDVSRKHFERVKDDD